MTYYPPHYYPNMRFKAKNLLVTLFGIFLRLPRSLLGDPAPTAPKRLLAQKRRTCLVTNVFHRVLNKQKIVFVTINGKQIAMKTNNSPKVCPKLGLLEKLTPWTPEHN